MRHQFRFFLLRYILCLISVLSTGVLVCAQDINIESVTIEQEKVRLKFILEDPNPDNRFTLRLYSSIDNYVQPLSDVSGNIGVDQRVGGNKEIVWDASKGLPLGFDDYVSFEIRAFVYIPFIEMEDLSQYGTFKRGRSYALKWSGGRGDNVLNFELYKGETKTGILFRDVANTGNWKMQLPKNTKPGSGYRFKIADQSNSDEVVFSGNFMVKRKVPLVFKVAGALLVGGVSYFIISSTGSDKPQEIPVPNDPK